ncbi:hypothetical protein GJ496_003978 [Pomphorhynchus laevis]|nr:hypothetical protein GJ496_003978 [Pomphorhynchus laevis]
MLVSDSDRARWYCLHETFSSVADRQLRAYKRAYIGGILVKRSSRQYRLTRQQKRSIARAQYKLNDEDEHNAHTPMLGDCKYREKKQSTPQSPSYLEDYLVEKNAMHNYLI